MKTVEMRKILREAGQKVPRNNPDVEKVYDEFIANRDKLPEKETKPEITSPVKLVSSNIYTYVGKGDTPPHQIKFMDIQWFTRGVATEVNPEILEAVSKHDCFRKGKVNMDDFYEQDKIEADRAEKQREEDQKLQIEIERQNRRA